jgi:hypothetical protein
MGRTRTAVPALMTSALLATALATGCGSSPKPLTRAQLTSRANAICRSVAVKVEAASKGGSANTPQQLERLTAKLAGFEQTALTELGRLVPPPALEADWKSFVAGAQTLAEDTVKIGEDAATKNTAAGKQVISSATSTQKQMAAVAKRDGLKACEQVP